MAPRIMGWKKDKYDPRAYLHRPLRIEEIPNVVILDAYRPEVRDQKDIGACVGFGIGANLTAWAKKQGVYSEWFSPTWIYNGARFIEGTLSEDAGAYPVDALDWLRKKGCLLERFWPYTGELDKTPPPSRLEPEAARYPLLEYFRVTGDANGICSAIAQGFPVSIGTPWFDKWMSPKKDGVLSNVTVWDSVVGGHETCLYGYDRLRKIFYGQNSWGIEYGKEGLFLMPFSSFSVFKKVGGYDAHYINVKWVVAPPEPHPVTGKKVKVLVSEDNGATWVPVYEG